MVHHANDVSELTVFGDELYYSADEYPNGVELWAYDGFNNPSMIADLNPNGSDANTEELIVFKNELYFSADDGINGHELWKLPTETIVTYS